MTQNDLKKRWFESESFEIVFFGEFISESFDVSSHGENHKRVSRENLTGEIENIKKYNFYKNAHKNFGKKVDS